MDEPVKGIGLDLVWWPDDSDEEFETSPYPDRFKISFDDEEVVLRGRY